MKTLFRLIPSPEEQRELFALLQRLHHADARTLVEYLLLVSPAPALQTSPKFGCDSGDCFYETSYDVDYSDYSGYDGYDKLDLNSSPDVWGGIDPSYAPNDIDFLHELHGPNLCGVFCELYGRFAPTDGELSHAMNDLANYDPGPRKIPPESGSVMAMSDFADDIDAELGEPSLPSGAHLKILKHARLG